MPSARDFGHRVQLILLIVAAIGGLALAGCGMPGAPQPPSLQLPNRVEDLSAVRAGDQVALTWTMPTRTTDKVALKGPIAARICRGQNSAAPCNVAATLEFAPGADAAFTDALPSDLASGAPRPLTYFVELVNRKGRCAGLSNGAGILAGQAPAPITGLTAEVRRDGVVLQWAPAPPDSPPTAVRLLRTLLTPLAKTAGQDALSAPREPAQRNLLVADGASGRALDSDIHFGESYEYRAQRVVRIAENGQTLELASQVSAPIRVDAPDIFPPAVPQGLAAVATAGENGNPPAIDLSWQPVTDANLAGYIVYRRENSGDWQRISPAQPVDGPGFHDANVQPGHTYEYAVSAIGQNGRESARSAETEETVPGP